ncbi:MAG TPA: helix-turn-helix domain-containing protein [Saprospiraceae bacterium]|nr:helix-turn-helix domain-containing protein [Saprospiraceae bacterium]
MFPEFNQYSIPLLILVIQGYVFAGLLLRRYFRKKHLPDLFLALLLAITAYQCTSYTIGFMGWYDTFRNTKVNYYLLDVNLLIGPVVYFYVRSITRPNQAFQRIDFWHFIPFLSWVSYELFVLIYDSLQPGFQDEQNGWWLKNIDFIYVAPFQLLLGYFSKILYFAFSIQIYWNYRRRIQSYFSNTYRVELNWIRNFLLIYCIALFLLQVTFEIIEETIIRLHWTQSFWVFLATAITAYYLGMQGYFRDISALFALTGKTEVSTTLQPSSPEKDPTPQGANYQRLEKLMIERQPYLESDLTLGDLAQQMGIPSNQLSQLINSHLDMNFNDYINRYRVEAIKQSIRAGEHQRKSLLGIALDCGFNSKATFNRTFKKFTHTSPSAYAKKISDQHP